MDDYRATLNAYLGRDGVTQATLAAAIGKTQATVARYARGLRFPDADTARDIERATEGAVPFRKWKAVTMARLGITQVPAPATEAKAA